MNKRMSKNPNLKWLILTLLLVILLAIPGYSWMKKDNWARAQRQKSMLSPVIMVPGSSATTERFNQLVRQLNSKTATKHSVLKIKVSTKGTLSYSETWSLCYVEAPTSENWYNTLVEKVSWPVKEAITERHKERLNKVLRWEKFDENT